VAAASTMIMVTMAAATAVTAYGQYQAGKAEQSALNYNAQVAERNAQIAQDKANYEADLQSQKVRRAIGSQRAAQLASGYLMEGSALDLQEDTVVQGELDRLAILYGGNIEAENYKSEAELSRMRGSAAAAAGRTAAFGTVLGGVAQTGYTGRQMGVSWLQS